MTKSETFEIAYNTINNSMSINRGKSHNVLGINKDIKNVTSALYKFCCSHYKCDVKLCQ
jgi:hypothetical protein